MIVKGDKEGKKLLNLLLLMKLTPKNMDLAEKYLDTSQPEHRELLKDAEHQNFTKLGLGQKEFIYKSLSAYKGSNAELAERLIRFAAEVGGATSRKMLAYNGWNSDFKYMQNILPLEQVTVLYADWVAWNTSTHCESSIQPLIALGKKDPEIFPQMMKLCYNDDACNTEMFLAGMYLRCVKPPVESRSILYVPMAENAGDDRAEGSPERIREMRVFLEERLMWNSAGLFIDADEPQGEEEEKLEAFIQDSDPREPFPYEMRALISNRRRNDYRISFLPFLAFLGVEHSNRFVSLIRFAAAIEGDTIPNTPLDVCQRTGQAWFRQHIQALEEVLWISDEAYIRWAILRRQREILERMAANTPDAVRSAIKKVPAEDYGYLLAQVKTGNARLYEEIGPALEADYRKIAAQQDVEDYWPAGDTARDYLLGIAEIQDILPYVEQWRELYLYDHWRYEQVDSYLEYGEDQLYRRALVLKALRLQHTYFKRYWVADGPGETGGRISAGESESCSRRQTEAILNLFDREQVPARYQIEYFGTACDNSYEPSICGPDSPSQICVLTLREKRGDWYQEWLDASESKYLPARILAYRVMDERWKEYKDRLLECAAESAKQGRDFLRAIYTGHRDWEADILAMLKSPKGDKREMAVEVLKNWDVEQYREPLVQALEAEKTKKIRTMIQELLAPKEQTAGDSEAEELAGEEAAAEGHTGTHTRTPEEIIKEALTGNRKRKLAWLSLGDMGKVHRLDGEEASGDYMAALLISYADMGTPGVNGEAQRLAAGLKPEELAVYMGEIFHRWIEDGAQAKKKWVLYAAAIHGGEAIVPVIYARIQEWPQRDRRGAIAAEAVKALALNGTSAALLLVDQTARKFKFRQVKAAAAEALDYAAGQLGISREELEDKIVPNLGFDERMERTFDYGKRQFKALLAPILSLEVYDGNGKALKSMPAPGKTDDPELSQRAYDAWKLLKKQLKTVVSNQKIRLEQALRIERRWETPKWRELFVKNPVMHQFAMGLVWGVYENGVLKDTFRYMEDGTFNTAREEEYELPEAGSIGLVHPIELSSELLTAWKEQIDDYEIVQPIEQLERPVYRVTEDEKKSTDLIRFGGMALNGLSLSGKLQDMGWYRGEVEDAGFYRSFYREDQDRGVALIFSGAYVGVENDTVVVYEAYFYQPGITEKVGWLYQPVRQKLGQVDPRYFSEVVLQLTRATASSEKRLDYPDCRKW